MRHSWAYIHTRKVLCARDTLDGTVRMARLMRLRGIDAADEPRNPNIEVMQAGAFEKHDPELSGAQSVQSNQCLTAAPRSFSARNVPRKDTPALNKQNDQI